MFIFAGKYLRRRQPTSIFSPPHSYSSSTTNLVNLSSKLYTKYGFKLPGSLKPIENPDPQPIKSPRKEPKPPYKPPSSLERVEPAHSELPFDFRFSYTESSSKVRPIGLREPKYSPFGPNRLDRVWTGVCAPVIDPKDGCVESEKELEDKRRLLREKIQGEPLSNAERKVLVESCSRRKTKQQINLGRDGLTHNMLDDIHNHWKHAEAVRIKCMGVSTVDMKNVCAQLEDKTFGQIICRHGGLLVLYRGGNYHPRKRPVIPLMMWKPQEPVYPKLIKTTIDGLSIEETKQLRKRGLSVPALTKLGRNGYYGRLVPMVRDAFLTEELVRIDCQGLDRSDYKKIGCKLKDLVPCILVTFAKEQIVVWKGKEYTPIHDDGFFLSERELFDNDDDDSLQSLDKNNKSNEDRGEGRRYFESDDDDDGLQSPDKNVKSEKYRVEGRRYFESDDDDGLKSPDKNDKSEKDRVEGRRYFESDEGLMPVKRLLETMAAYKNKGPKTNTCWLEWKGLGSLKQEVSNSNPCECKKPDWKRSPPLVPDRTSND